MLRFLLRRIPRFGFVTLFAAMLLFVSVAGWAKWNLELWQEEQALLADLGKAGVNYSYSRGSGAYVGARPGWTQPWGVWSLTPPMLSRIDSIFLRGAAPRDLVVRAASLPCVKSVISGPIPATPNLPAEAIAREFGFEPAELDASAIETSVAELPHGEPVEPSQAAAYVSRIVEAWNRPATAPMRGISEGLLVLPGRNRTFQVRSDDVRFVASDGSFAIWTPASYDAFVQTRAGFEQSARIDEAELAKDLFVRANPQMISFDPKRALVENLATYKIDAPFEASLQASDQVRVERIDARTVRFDLPPIVVDYPGAGCEDAYAISLVARSDLDWALEAWDVRGVRTETAATPKGLPPVASVSYRGTLRREGEWVVIEAWVSDRLGQTLAPAPGQPATLTPYRHAEVARYEFSPDLDLSHVTPELFDAKMLPPRRKLPWLRWHRVTFGLSLGLFAFVAARRIASGRRVSLAVEGA